MMARYGPGDLPPSSSSSPIRNNTVHVDGSTTSHPAEYKERLRSDFAALLSTIVNDTTPVEEYPSLLAQNVETVLNVIGYEHEMLTGKDGDELADEAVLGDGPSLLEGILRDEIERSGLDETSEAANIILSFAETFAEQTKSMDDVYKRLLGKIFKIIAPEGATHSHHHHGDESDTPAPAAPVSAPAIVSAATTEERLDQLLSEEREAFTPGFLRHVEGECERISSLPELSPESARMLQMLRLIQTRVLEELGKGIGEGAIVLGQLLGYDDKSERLAVLDAGLAVRGTDFAQELAALTEEALAGFEAMPGGAEGGVDPVLVESVRSIDERIRRFISRMESKFQ